MSEKKEQMLETFGKLIPKMTETEKAHLLGFCEGLVARDNRNEADGDSATKTGRKANRSEARLCN